MAKGLRYRKTRLVRRRRRSRRARSPRSSGKQRQHRDDVDQHQGAERVAQAGQDVGPEAPHRRPSEDLERRRSIAAHAEEDLHCEDRQQHPIRPGDGCLERAAVGEERLEDEQANRQEDQGPDDALDHAVDACGRLVERRVERVRHGGLARSSRLTAAGPVPANQRAKRDADPHESPMIARRARVRRSRPDESHGAGSDRGSGPRAAEPGRDRLRAARPGAQSSRWTVSGLKAGRHTATYSAPWGSGVE